MSGFLHTHPLGEPHKSRSTLRQGSPERSRRAQGERDLCGSTAVFRIKDLVAIGFSLPSPAYIFAVILFGVIGYAAYRYGKKTAHNNSKCLGIAMMLYPYAISETWQLYAVGTALSIGLYVFR